MAYVYWITGLSGAGKTTIGKLYYEKLKKKTSAVVFLDGDMLRESICSDLGYSKEERKECAMRYSRLCKLLSEQGITVIICTISMFHTVRAWNRENIMQYKEIYIKVPMKILKERDQKGLYSRTSREGDATVSGIDIKFEEPLMPDIVLENTGEKSPVELVERIQSELKDDFI